MYAELYIHIQYDQMNKLSILSIVILLQVEHIDMPKQFSCKFL